MNRVLIQLGPITIYWYSVLILVAVLMGYEVIVKYCKKIDYQVNLITDMLFWLVIWAIVGARTYYVIFNFSAFKDNLLGIFMVWNGGIAIYGAIIGGACYIAYYCYKYKLDFIKVLDIFTLSLMLGQAIGRWGNFFNSEAYGGITTYSHLKGLMIPEFIIRGMYIDGAYRQPTFLYESLWCLIGVIILFFIRKKFSNIKGVQLYFYLSWYGIGRFFIEGLRSDSLYLGSFRVSQIVSLLIVMIGIVGFISLRYKGKILKKNWT